MRASELGLDQREVVDNVITALTSNQMIAPSYWIDPKTGNDYMLTVQYPEQQVKNLADLRAIPLRAAGFCAADAAGHDQQYQPDQIAYRGRSLSIAAHHRYLRSARCMKIWAESRTGSMESSPRPMCRRG